ncbi:methyltransferase domain-containing protein [Actinosynnema pretiosum subsp. pretiosum]|uniref:Methyltransferase type 12 n=2 Tax=Actinosynnema TaxID=40566 RepID=C6WDG4_ACTMD|nr:methyltransferase domain-containing protein [Actinosynnema mirum]ACU39601.1 Methyltransferase type 12 [Actinosynnema mirum DSM 43827]QUF03044.1 methyltransferase domain-containing protein [Actinosynnema pretiosum subsp. pretiosum]
MRPDAVQRVLDTELTAARDRRGGEPPRVLDVGGGTGVWAVQLAAAGCAVTVVDPSPDALATLTRRAAEAGVADRVIAVQGDTDALGELVSDGAADLVLGHGLLEVVDDAATALAALAAAAAPGGAVSVLVANRYAAVLHRAIGGRIVDARRLLDDEGGQLAGTRDPLLRRFDVTGLETLVSSAGLAVEILQGHGVVADLVPGAVLEANPGAAEALAELELAAATRSPLRDVAARLHVLARRTG